MSARPDESTLVLSTALPGASGALAVAAGVCVADAIRRRHLHEAPLLVELDPPRSRGPTVLSSAPAGQIERRLRSAGFERAAARGRICWLGLSGGEEGLAELDRAVSVVPGGCLVVAHVPPQLWPSALEHARPRPSAGLLRAELPAARSLTALAVDELRGRGIRARVASRQLGAVGSRRTLAGLEPGGAANLRLARLAQGLIGRVAHAARGDRGQALPLVLGAALALIFVALVLTGIGGALTAGGRLQRVADLAALSGARSLRDDFSRLFEPSRLPDGSWNRNHLDRAEYLARATDLAREAAFRNGLDPDEVTVTFPDERSFAPLRIRIEVRADATAQGPNSQVGRVPVSAAAEAEASPPASPEDSFGVASGGGYVGPLASRQGKPMRPDVAVAFDRLAEAARHDGFSLTITSAYRSDAEQARLYAAHPDPRWVAPPGQSLHRCATELDLGPPSAYGWLASNARRFGFLKRYSWEPWHFGYVRGPAPCSAAGSTGGATPSAHVGRLSSRGLPSFVPSQFRAPIERAAGRWNVSAELLAAQLMAESNFNPFAVSSTGAQGIAQFIPATAQSYGLSDPFNATASIDAQAHLMSDLMRQFDSVSLALAAYNAGPGAVDGCRCVPSIPETQAYVARILGLMGGAGEAVAPTLEVRLVS